MLAPNPMPARARRSPLVLLASLVATACGASPAPASSEAPAVVIAQPSPPAAAPSPVAENEAAPETEPVPAPMEPVTPEPGAAQPPPSPWLAGPTSTNSNFVENDGELVIGDPIVFQTGKEQLKPESIPALGVVGSYLRAKPEVTLMRIEVHTDSMGNDQANQVLSERRALTVARFLVANGIDCRRLIAVGFGETKPIAPNTTAEGRAMNRRTTFFTAAVRGKPFNRRPLDGGGNIAGDACR